MSLSDIEKKLGYSFRDKSLIRQAFTRTSYCNEHPAESYQSNEVLEFFGDGVLSVTIISFLLGSHTERYRHGIKTELGEGDFSNIRSKLSDKTNLSKSIERLGLQKYLLIGEGDKKLGIEKEPSVMEDLFESIIGAVYIDSDKNMAAVAHVVESILDMSVYHSNSKPSQSAKNSLQEYCAEKSRRLPQPEYKTLKEEGPDHKKSYTRGVYIGGELIATGVGKNLKLADAKAAEAALIKLAEREDGENKKKSPPRAKAARSDGMADDPKASTKKKTRSIGSGKAENASQKNGAPANKGERGKSLSPTKKNPTNKDKASPRTASARLKRYAQEKSIATPAYYDLGMIRTHSGAIEYKIECRFNGTTTTATGKSRPEAKERASLEMARALNIKV